MRSGNGIFVLSCVRMYERHGGVGEWDGLGVGPCVLGVCVLGVCVCVCLECVRFSLE